MNNENNISPLIESSLNNEAFYDYISNHIADDTFKLRLKDHRATYDFDVLFAILQIECRAKMKKKLPAWNNNPRIVYPSALACEQCTSEVLAEFHSTLVNEGEDILDMTGGLGVDVYYNSKKCSAVTYIDIQSLLANIVKHNLHVLGVNNVAVVNADSISYLNDNNEHYDTIFIDPARRDENKNRVYAFTDCMPNIIENKELIYSKCNSLIVKASPMIDITQSINMLPGLTDVYVLSIKNECKELVFKLNTKNKAENISIHCINYRDSIEKDEYTYSYGIENTLEYNIAKEVKKYIYEPNASIMKAGCFKSLSQKIDTSVLDANTHIFTSNNIIKDFPGKAFEVMEILPYKSNIIKEINKKYPKANVATRNFVLSAIELKKKLKISDGGDVYVYGVSSVGKQLLVICKRI